ncbi:hypothetical protein C8R44DRAFT_881248 [Mycena epipterygia]|nr:hypothetical protein C8R44DRAFT_881248 [Mycena epipterygia]
MPYLASHSPLHSSTSQDRRIFIITPRTPFPPSPRCAPSVHSRAARAQSPRRPSRGGIPARAPSRASSSFHYLSISSGSGLYSRAIVSAVSACTTSMLARSRSSPDDTNPPLRVFCALPCPISASCPPIRQLCTLLTSTSTHPRVARSLFSIAAPPRLPHPHRREPRLKLHRRILGRRHSRAHLSAAARARTGDHPAWQPPKRAPDWRFAAPAVTPPCPCDSTLALPFPVSPLRVRSIASAPGPGLVAVVFDSAVYAPPSKDAAISKDARLKVRAEKDAGKGLRSSPRSDVLKTLLKEMNERRKREHEKQRRREKKDKAREIHPPFSSPQHLQPTYAQQRRIAAPAASAPFPRCNSFLSRVIVQCNPRHPARPARKLPPHRTSEADQ